MFALHTSIAHTNIYFFTRLTQNMIISNELNLSKKDKLG